MNDELAKQVRTRLAELDKLAAHHRHEAEHIDGGYWHNERLRGAVRDLHNQAASSYEGLKESYLRNLASIKMEADNDK